MIVNKTLSWQISRGDIDHYEVGVADEANGVPTVVGVTTGNVTSITVTYSTDTYPTAWLFVRSIEVGGSASPWSDAIYGASIEDTFTIPRHIQYCYPSDIKDALLGFSLPTTFTDKLLNRICIAASRDIDNLCGKKFSPQSTLEKYDGSGTSQLILNHFPVLSINQVTITDGSGLQIIRQYTPSDLELSDFESGILQLKPVLLDNAENDWEMAASLLYGHIFSTGKNNVLVSYQYGYLEEQQNDELVLVSTTSTGGSSGSTIRTYRTFHHNLSPNNIAVYRNGSLLSSYSVDTAEGLVSIADGNDDDLIIANYFYTIPSDIELATTKIAAMSTIVQVAAKTTGGATSFRNMNYQESYGARPYSGLLDQLQSEAQAIIVKYKDFMMGSV